MKFLSKLILSGMLLSPAFLFAQDKAPDNWFNLDKKDNKVLGVSSEKAYQELLQGKTGKTIIVAVIDGGTDVNHEDLKSIIWNNEDEIAGNGIDDDNNGYIDDVHGWNFIGGKDGSHVNKDTYELTRLYGIMKGKYEGADYNTLNAQEKLEYTRYQTIRKEYMAAYTENKEYSDLYSEIMEGVNTITRQLGPEPTVDALKSYKPASKGETIAHRNLLGIVEKGGNASMFKEQLSGALDHFKGAVDYSYNPDFNPRTIVGDNYLDANERYYGNNDVAGPSADHGTHVAGIIAAIRDNSIGMKGVANNVRIMVLRVVPDGDERDKDVANAIRYAADNGAVIVNMSFGKSFSFNKKVVDDAVKYAASKDVLLIHAAGNDGKNTDIEDNFPNDKYEGTTEACPTWIEVGACSYEDGKDITAEFSNYGYNNVDLFAPGVSIYSTTPGSKYAAFDGTSMAAPVTAGVAALVRSYYPNLKATEVKEILMSSVTKVKGKVHRPGDEKKVKMKTLCQSAGVVNAYNALKMAATRSSASAAK